MAAAADEHTPAQTPHSEAKLKQCPHQPTMTELTGNLRRAKKRAFNISLPGVSLCLYEDEKWIWSWWCGRSKGPALSKDHQTSHQPAVSRPRHKTDS